MERSQSHYVGTPPGVTTSPWPVLAHRETRPSAMAQNQTQPSPKTTASWEKSLSVLAFGDSLTVGMISDSPHKPYGSRLAELLGVPAESVTTSGCAGQLTGDMAQRLQKELRLNARKPFTHVVILGGTNDLREGLPPETVINHLTGLYNMVRASGAKCVAVTIPRFGPRDAILLPVTQQREQVNSVLRSMAASPGQGKEPFLKLADLDQAIERVPASERNSLFSDSIHFSASGYELLGDLAYKAITGSTVSTAPSQLVSLSRVRTTKVLASSRSMVAPVAVRMPLSPPGSTVHFQPTPTSSALSGRSRGTWTQSPVRRSTAGRQCQPLVRTSRQSTVCSSTSFYFSPRMGLTVR